MNNSVKQALSWAYTQLKNISSSPQLEADILLAKVLSVTKSHLYTWPEQQLDTQQEETFSTYVKRRLAGEPIAYILGEREFWSLTFKITPEVLIPRAETESLIEFVLKTLPTTKQQLLDLGTGSGAIAIALACERPNWRLTATDKSPSALAVACENANNHKIETVHFMESDWYSALGGAKFHAIISNPPYIAYYDPHLQKGDLRFEPRLALSSAEQGLAAINLITTQAPFYLRENGLLVIEHGYQQAEQVRAMFNKSGFNQVMTHADLAGLPRFCSGYLGKH